MRMGSAILKGGVSAASLDIMYAFIAYGPLTFGLTPVQVLQSVARGWLGRDAAMAGGAATATLGLATHFALAFLMAAIFVGAARRWPTLIARPALWGLAYGIVLYVGMTYVVTPLSASATGRFPGTFDEIAARLGQSFSAIQPASNMLLIGTILTHTLFVGLPIALIARREVQR